MKLTEAGIRRALPDAGQKELRDDAVRGLILRGNANRATWSIRFTDGDGRRSRYKLGVWPGLGLTDARRAAQAWLGQVALGGKPPAPEKAALTLDAALDLARVGYGSRLRRPDEPFRMIRRTLAELLPRPVNRITKADVLTVTDKLRPDRDATANATLRYAKPVWRWLAERDHCPDILASVRIPQTNIRDRFLTMEEAKEVWEATDGFSYPFGPLFKVLMLTGQRRTEVAGMRWAEVDLKAGVWTLPAERVKNNQPFAVPLVPQAVDVLRGIRDYSGCEFVFSTNGLRPVSGFSKAKAKLDRLSGVEDWVLHDIRRTIVTVLADAGWGVADVDRLLNHVAAASNSRVARIYNRSDLMASRRAMSEAWAEALVGPAPRGNLRVVK